MFNKTIWRNWEGKDNCKCFFPMDDVSVLQGVPKKWLKEVLVTKITFLTSLQLHSYSWYCQKVWVFWACTTNFLIPTVLILLIWGLMVHHYIVNPASDQTSRWQEKIIFLIFNSPCTISGLWKGWRRRRWWSPVSFSSPSLPSALFSPTRDSTFPPTPPTPAASTRQTSTRPSFSTSHLPFPSSTGWSNQSSTSCLLRICEGSLSTWSFSKEVPRAKTSNWTILEMLSPTWTNLVVKIKKRFQKVQDSLPKLEKAQF